MTIDDILKSLPTRDDLAKIVGREARSNMHDDVLTLLGVFGTGMLLGAGLALLFAPKAGPELRRDIADTLSKVGARNPAEGGGNHQSDAAPAA